MRFRALEQLRAMDRAFKALDALVPPAGIVMPAGGLMEFIPALTPSFSAPRHLAPLIDVLERAPREPLRVVVTCSPRLGKTESIAHAIPKWLRDDPTCPVMYGAANASLAISKSARARDLAVAAGVRLSTHSKSKTEWLVLGPDGRPAGGGVRAFSVEGSPIGHGARVAVIDDPISGRAQAESQGERDRIWETLRSGWFTRIEPGGSIIIVQQRWHPDDPAGRALAEGWDEVRITPYTDSGESIWPERFSIGHWQELEIEVGPLNWISQYMGRPSVGADRLFGDAILCEADEVPADAVDIVGCDLAYTASKRSDDQGAVVMARSGQTYYIRDGVSRRAHLVTEVRGTRREPGFTQDLRRLQADYRAREIVQYTGGREDATISLLAKLAPEERVRIRGMHATSDKLQRIQPFLGAYRAGRVKIVRGAFADKLVAHLAQFTGAKNGKDDLADACAAAFDAHASGGRSRASGTGEGSRALDMGRSIVA